MPKHRERDRRVGHPDAEARDSPRDDRRPTGYRTAEHERHSKRADRHEKKPDSDERRRPDAENRPFLDPRTARPRDCARGQRQPRDEDAFAAKRGDRERDEHIGREEREREQPSREHGRWKCATGRERARREQAPERRHPDSEAGREHDRREHQIARLQRGEHEGRAGRDRDRIADDAARRAATSLDRAQFAKCETTSDENEGQQAEEHPPPRKPLCDHDREGGTGDARYDPRCGEDREHARP